MKYMGSKARHAKEIIDVILANSVGCQTWVEPFVGGANIIDKVPSHFKRLGNDINNNLISMFIAIQNGWKPPCNVTEQDYYEIKTNPEKYPKELVAFVAIGCSYSGKWWGGYARGKSAKGFERNYCLESRNNLLSQNLKDVVFTSVPYQEMCIPAYSIIYCDPPYAGTTKYVTGGFDHSRFWTWCDEQVSKGQRVFVSEYTAPDHWKCVWEKKVNNTLTQDTGSKQGVERLFTRALEDA